MSTARAVQFAVSAADLLSVALALETAAALCYCFATLPMQSLCVAEADLRFSVSQHLPAAGAARFRLADPCLRGEPMCHSERTAAASSVAQ
jgi:hypothetical protein